MRFLLAFIVLVGSVAVASTLWYQQELKPVDSASSQRITVTVEQGMSVEQIADLLQERGLIRSVRAFRLYLRFTGEDRGIKAGRFILQPSQSVQEIVDILRSGRGEEIVLTIPEGYTVTDIDKLLVDSGLAEAGAFVRCAQECDLSDVWFLPESVGLAERGGIVEGYLYPDTYFVEAQQFDIEQFMRRLLHTFEQKVIEAFPEQLARSDRSLHEAITMASLIEKEASNDTERPIIAGILWKRYSEGLGLGVDATVRYILNKPTTAITVADLNTNSPYNTRKFRGLPPGPIASPGQQSIVAAFNPSETEYWYYLHDPEGRIYYAKTNEEHNINRYLYLR